MGRYYSTETGRDGKFGFAKQSSTDPGDFFGMKEQEPNQITYYADKDDEEDIKAKVDSLYDELEVPAEERIYYKEVGSNNDELADLLQKYGYRKVHRNEVKRFDEIEGYKHGPYYCPEEHYVFIETKQGAGLAMCRIRLGVTILSDLKDEGFCELYAEL